MFTEDGDFTVPASVTSVRALAVGGGGGGCSSANGGGGSGYVAAETISVNPDSTYHVTVGKGGDGKDNNEFAAEGPITRNLASESSFLTLTGKAGEEAYAKGGEGGSGGGGGSGRAFPCVGDKTAQGGSGGSDGSSCGRARGGYGQGSYVNLLAIFTKSLITPGKGGMHGRADKNPQQSNSAGGGAGGVLIDGKGPNGENGNRDYDYCVGGEGGQGYGAGGGAGGYSCKRGNVKGGAGAPGVVYIEWD